MKIATDSELELIMSDFPDTPVGDVETNATSYNATSTNATSRRPADFNVNTYATQKTMTAGAMDIALITSNANQIKLLAASQMKTIEILTMTMLGISLILQFIVAFFIIYMGSSTKVDLNSKEEEQVKKQRRLNNFNQAVLGMVGFITVINVLASQIAASSAKTGDELD